MRIVYLLIFLALPFFSFTQDLTTRFEKSGGAQTSSYHEVIEWWKKLDAESPFVSMKTMGPTDAGYPLHLVLISADQDFDISSLKKKGKVILFVNNGIHPGEPDGIDASMILGRELVLTKSMIPENVVLALIPVYNIGGALNRSQHYRVDQNGPVEIGFRGNAQNLDLNRDFIKADSKNALSFAKIFHYLDPDVFIDNHVSNGSDYQHVMTLITTQHNKLGGEPGAYINKNFEPAIYDEMKRKGWDLVPYVNHFGATPDKGWSEFWDSPRYSSGYAALWNCFAFVPETHMLKPYDQRVHATKDLMKSFIAFTSEHGREIIRIRSRAKKQQASQEEFPIAWKWDHSRSSEIIFKGYESGNKPSAISGLPRLYYDRTKPFEKKVPFYNQYLDTLSIDRPLAYIIPQGWWKVIERLEANNIKMRRFTNDTTLQVEGYKIDSYQSGQRPFEGHHLNTGVKVSKNTKTIRFRKGDYFIPMNQDANRFLIHVLEPPAEDSYFAWNFFDPILGQKEGYSDYVFEETALEYLNKNPELKQRLEERKRTDSVFANSGRAQLNFIYQNSPYYEPAHMQYPVYRIARQ